MALLQSILANGLAALSATDQEAIAIQRFATAFDDYFQGASVLGIQCIPGTTASAKAALIAAMSGASADNAAAGKISSGIQAYWAAIAPLATAVWAGTVGPVVPPAVPPPGLAGIESAVQAAFSASTTGGLPLATAASALATAIHSTQLGGMVNLGPPPPGGVPNVPIL